MPSMPAPDAPARKLTYEDYCAIPDDGQRHEILDGVHFVSPSPLEMHQSVLGNFYLAFATFLRKSRLGVVRLSPSDVLLGPHDIVQPDLYILRRDSTDRLERRGCSGAPDLVIEILSPGNVRYDLVKKLPRYELKGVEEYWAVHTDTERIEVHRREGEGFGRPLLLERSRGDSVTTPLFPGFEATLEELFFRNVDAVLGTSSPD